MFRLHTDITITPALSLCTLNHHLTLSITIL
jgi:hypothetical protein